MSYPVTRPKPPSQISPAKTSLREVPPAPGQPQRWLAQILRDRIVQIGIAAWILLSALILLLAHGTVPFDQPALAGVPYSLRVWGEILGPVYALILIAVIFALTHGRTVDIAVQVPEKSVARRETIAVLVYGTVVLIVGQFVGRWLGIHGLGLHLSGSMFGLSEQVAPREVYAWSIYNFIFYALIPYCAFRWRGYSNQQLCLRSSDLRNDILVIVCVLGIGLAGDLRGNPIWRLSGHQFAAGGTIAFVASLFGTGLPIMIFLTSILIPRYKKLTGSTAATVVLGGFTYAALHLSEYWTRYDTSAHGALSFAFIMLLFGGPGMVKSYLTQRTGNAWVHLWGYHAIWPHVTDDTVTFVKIFQIQ
jgi:hypothetical protein